MLVIAGFILFALGALSGAWLVLALGGKRRRAARIEPLQQGTGHADQRVGSGRVSQGIRVHELSGFSCK